MSWGTNSPRNVTKYEGPDYTLIPRYIRKRDPTSLTLNVDIRPKEQQGYYPIGSIWINTLTSNVWVLANIVTVTQGGVTGPAPDWVLLSSSTHLSLKLAVPAGTSPVSPSNTGLITYTSTDGSVTMTGNAITNTIDFSVVAASSGIQQVAVDILGPVTPVGAPKTITITSGAPYATGTNANALKTDGTVANTIEIELQKAGANAAVSTPNNFGIAQFDSNSFGVASGFVTLNNAGTTGPVTKILGDDGGANSVVPSAGVITLDGVTVLNGANSKPVFFKKNAVSTEELDVQVTTTSTSGAKNINKAGLASFDSAIFTVDAATGWISLVGGSLPPALKFTASGGVNPVGPDGSGNVNIFGSGSLTTIGSANTVTIEFTGLTNHAILVAGASGTTALTQIAAGTTGQILQTNTGADPTWSTATYPSTTTINQLLYSSAANTVTGLAVTNNSVLTSGATGVPTWSNMATNGAVLIGSAGGPPVPSVLTPGAGISISNGANSITISATAVSMSWADIAVNTAVSSNNGYFATAALTATLPPTPNQGDVIRFVVDTASVLTIQAQNGKQIRIGNVISAVNGTIASTKRGDSVDLVYRAAANTWFAVAGVQGSWTVT